MVGAHAFNGFLLPGPTCSAGYATTAITTPTAANGDQVIGTVTGGEIYELALAVAGDGQESFLAVTITGGTGRFAGASGSFVTHSIISFASGIISSEIMSGGTIGY